MECWLGLCCLPPLQCTYAYATNFDPLPNSTDLNAVLAIGATSPLLRALSTIAELLIKPNTLLTMPLPMLAVRRSTRKSKLRLFPPCSAPLSMARPDTLARQTNRKPPYYPLLRARSTRGPCLPIAHPIIPAPNPPPLLPPLSARPGAGLPPQ